MKFNFVLVISISVFISVVVILFIIGCCIGNRVKYNRRYNQINREAKMCIYAGDKTNINGQGAVECFELGVRPCTSSKGQIFFDRHIPTEANAQLRNDILKELRGL